MNKATEEQIIKITTEALNRINTAEKHSIDELKKMYPFHAIFFPDEALPYAKKERFAVTYMGKTFFPRLAEVIAKERYSIVEREYQAIRDVSVSKLNAINKIINDLRANKTKPDHFKELDTISTAEKGNLQHARVIADIYIGDHEDGELFIELKSPKPNLDVCDESKRKVLTFLAIKMEEKKKARALLGLTYNPDGEGNPYKWSITKQILDMENQVAIGKKLWDLIGGRGTFEAILRIAEKTKETYYKETGGQSKLT